MVILATNKWLKQKNINKLLQALCLQRAIMDVPMIYYTKQPMLQPTASRSLTTI